jgi:hypothetical protein
VRPSSTSTLSDLANAIPTGETVEIDAAYNTAFYVLLIQVCAAYICYIFGQSIFFVSETLSLSN